MEQNYVNVTLCMGPTERCCVGRHVIAELLLTATNVIICDTVNIQRRADTPSTGYHITTIFACRWPVQRTANAMPDLRLPSQLTSVITTDRYRIMFVFIRHKR